MVKDSRIYCGDFSNLPNTYDRFGSRHECMQCGFGAAMMKYKWQAASKDPEYPSRNKKGCLRVRKHKKGTVKGNQFGKTSGKTSGMSPNKDEPSYIYCITIWIIYCITLFCVLYFKKPNCVTDDSKDKNINWSKFIKIYILYALILTFPMLLVLYMVK